MQVNNNLVNFAIPEKESSLQEEKKNVTYSSNKTKAVSRVSPFPISKGKIFTPIRKRPSKRSSKKKTFSSTQKGIGRNIKDKDGDLTKKKSVRFHASSEKTGALNARLRQLRRRISRQVIKPVPRRRPRSGGFVWPGDYLRLEQTESPKLILKNTENNLQKAPNLENSHKSSSSSVKQISSPLYREREKELLNLDKTALKENLMTDSNQQKSTLIPLTRKIEKKAILLDLYVQPRKYLLEKHNIKVIKKKLEKSQRTNQIKQRIKEFQLMQNK
jgi:hypothetical protein